MRQAVSSLGCVGWDGQTDGEASWRQKRAEGGRREKEADGLLGGRKAGWEKIK